MWVDLAWFGFMVRDRLFEGCILWDYRVGLLWGVELSFFLMMAFLLFCDNLHCMSMRVSLIWVGDVVFQKGRMNDGWWEAGWHNEIFSHC